MLYSNGPLAADRYYIKRWILPDLELELEGSDGSENYNYHDADPIVRDRIFILAPGEVHMLASADILIERNGIRWLTRPWNL